MDFNHSDVLTIRDPYRDNCGTFISLENIIWIPGVVVRNCNFEPTNTRGLLVEFEMENNNDQVGLPINAKH